MEKRIFLLIPGGVLTGLGVGLAIGAPAPGLFIGLGAAFIIIAMYSVVVSRENSNKDV